MTLSDLVYQRAEFRICYADTIGGTWTIASPSSGRTPGLDLTNYQRTAFPQIGDAQLTQGFGRYVDDPAGQTPNNVTPPPLAGKYIRIQMRPAEAAGGAWETVWLGICESERDTRMPASSSIAGTRNYFCRDLMSTLKHRLLLAHGYAQSGVERYGNPGYNIDASQTRGDNAETGGNTGGNGDSYNDHTLPGRGALWSDLEVIEHALASSSRTGDASWLLSDPDSLLNGENTWTVGNGETCLSLLSRICDRRRGVAIVILDWDESGTSDSSAGTIQPKLVVKPQVYSDITVRPPLEANYTIPGANSGSAVDITLEGDHRAPAGGFMPTTFEPLADVIEIRGDPIRVTVTLSADAGTVQKGWTNAQETGWTSGDPDEQYQAVYTRWMIPDNWNFQANNGTASDGLNRVDFRCLDNGVVPVLSTNPANDPNDTSPANIKLLPWILGDSSGGTEGVANEQAVPFQKQALTLVQNESDGDEWTIYNGQTRTNKGGSIQTYKAAEYNNGTRGLEGQEDLVAFSLTIELPHRVRMAGPRSDDSMPGDQNGPASTTGRRRTIDIPGLGLWYVSANAILAVDNAGAATRLGATTAVKDDRNTLARIQAYAEEWYTRTHVGATITHKSCASLNGASDDAGGGWSSAPNLGDVIHNVTTGGDTVTLDTPVTRISYSQGSGVSTIVTDWQDIDLT